MSYPQYALDDVFKHEYSYLYVQLKQKRIQTTFSHSRSSVSPIELSRKRKHSVIESRDKSLRA